MDVVTLQFGDMPNKVFDLLTAYPQTLLLIPLAWIILVVILRLLSVRITGVALTFSLIVSVGIVIGILLLWVSRTQSMKIFVR